jgi:ParB family chromosome partitioning protein
MAERRRGLGRGLDALIPQGVVKEGFALIPVDHVGPNPRQPREHFDEAGLEALAASIREVGILQPVVVRPTEEGRYELIAGERRWRAARIAGLGEIPAMVRSEEAAWNNLTEALIENIQREDLTPLEEAAAYRQLMEDFGLTHEQVGERVGKSRSTITNALRLLQLPSAIQGLLDRGELSVGHAKALLGLEDRAYAEHIGARAAAEGWSVRMVEDAVRARSGAAPGARRRTPSRRVRSPEILALEEQLGERLGAKVDIAYDGSRGKLVVRFGSLDDLERIYRTLFEG